MMPRILAAVFAMFSMCVLLAVADESYAQMFVVVNTFYKRIIKN